MSFKNLKESHVEEHGVGSSQWKAFWDLGILLMKFTIGGDTFYARTWFSADESYIFTSVQGRARSDEVGKKTAASLPILKTQTPQTNNYRVVHVVVD